MLFGSQLGKNKLDSPQKQGTHRPDNRGRLPPRLPP